eukprot:CAMPEP_0180527142 /NCGR_PEP_ID=MMETSP1036_2-20121128/60078_1 /TAXON_ID=632150 /ORGANISM="Azadinium spinosum, Strain 3D9" /LENGTH=41 /DNA_ID= /DNA_START= /DNA_END= /DNA_ORIENTATION=
MSEGDHSSSPVAPPSFRRADIAIYTSTDDMRSGPPDHQRLS